jgi:two-component system OmpR family sensor kinase
MKKNRVPKQIETLAQEDFFREIDLQFLIHELKGPLAVIETGMRALLERREKYGHLSSLQEKTIKRALRNTRKAHEMVYGLLAVGQSQTGVFRFSSFEPAEAVFEALSDALEITVPSDFETLSCCQNRIEALAHLHTCGIFFDIEPDVNKMIIYQDRYKFYQIIGNLLKNALFHRKNQMTLRVKPDGEWLVVEVSDDGPGIAPQDHEKVFQRYKQADTCSFPSRSGHGLGLAGALVMARCLGGDIQLESQIQKGTTFRLRLPISQNTAAGS